MLQDKRYLSEFQEGALDVSALRALDRGAYREAILRYENSSPSDDPIETIWRAEVALYLERLDDARAELHRLATPLNRNLANRVANIRAELAFYNWALDEAREIVTPVVDWTREAGDDEGYLRASIMLGRIELRRDNAKAALEKLEQPRRLATALGNDYRLGFISHCRALAFYLLGDYKHAGPAMAEAMRLLGQSENGRWEATARNLYGSLLKDLEQFEEALAEFEHAERISLELGIISEALFCRNNAASVLHLMGRYEEVIERITDTLKWERETQFIFAELFTTMILAQAHFELGNYDESERAADELALAAEIAKVPVRVLDGKMMGYRVRARRGDKSAVDALKALVLETSAYGEYLQAEVRLYLAEALCSTDPVAAASYCSDATRLAATEESAYLRGLLRRIERTLSEGPIRIGPHGELIIDTRLTWPEYDAAIDAVKRHLILGAVEKSDGNRSEAARKLNLTRSRLHDLWHQLHGEPVRPPR